MTINRFAIDATTLPFGVAEVFFGDATVAGGLDPIGLIEGDVVANIRRRFNQLRFEEHTGGAVIKEKTQIDGVNVTIPLMITDEAMIAKLLPGGVISLGEDNFQPTVPQTLLIIAQEEIDETTGMSKAVDPALIVPVPKNALWIWKARPALDRLVWGFTDMGKRMVEVPFEALYDTTKPAKHKLATFGDPVAQGITGLLI